MFRVDPEAGWLPANLFLAKPVDPARLLAEAMRLTSAPASDKHGRGRQEVIMKILKMAKQNLDLFVSVLPAFGEVYAPVKRGKGFVFDRPSLWSDVQMNYTRTMLPPKKLMLPPRETTFAFDPEQGVSRICWRKLQSRWFCSEFMPMTFTA